MIKEISYEELIKYFNVDKNNSPFLSYLGYYLEDNIVGYIEYSIMYEKAEVINIFVNKEFRNRKIGSNMLKYLILSLKDKNIYNITLEVNINNQYAIKLYKKYNFKKVAIRTKYYNGVDGILMELIL